MMTGIKRLVCVLCTLAMMLPLTACAGDTRSDISMYELEKAMLSADDTLPEMLSAGSWEENGEKTFPYLSDLDYNKIQDYFLAYASDGMAYEIAVIRLRDKADASAVEASLRTHLESRVRLYKTYEPEQMERAESALIKTEGSFVMLIMCDNAQEVENAFCEFIR